jgi:hypothetical protein
MFGIPHFSQDVSHAPPGISASSHDAKLQQNCRLPTLAVWQCDEHACPLMIFIVPKGRLDVEWTVMHLACSVSM